MSLRALLIAALTLLGACGVPSDPDVRTHQAEIVGGSVSPGDPAVFAGVMPGADAGFDAGESFEPADGAVLPTSTGC